MSQNPSNSMPTPRDIYYAARRALFLIPDEKQEEVKDLLKRGHKGEKVHHQVLEIFSRYPAARAWLEDALYPSTRRKTTMRGPINPPGDPGPIPARSVWVCPRCGFTWRVLRQGRPVPPCPHDGSALVLQEPSDAG